MLAPYPSIERQVVLDTETTGLQPEAGHRVIEIGGVELLQRRITQRRFHVYLNPERHIEPGALEVHGITNEFLASKPRFAEIVEDFLDFIRGAELIIHNAAFDVGFLNYELALCEKQTGQIFGRIGDHATVFDTLLHARQKHPGQRNSLDALCKRYDVDHSGRELHGALLDAEILAEVYLRMTGGQVSLLDLSPTTPAQDARITPLKTNRPPLPVIVASDEELARHRQRWDW